mgnify:CR=1 FL=1
MGVVCVMRLLGVGEGVKGVSRGDGRGRFGLDDARLVGFLGVGAARLVEILSLARGFAGFFGGAFWLVLGEAELVVEFEAGIEGLVEAGDESVLLF